MRKPFRRKDTPPANKLLELPKGVALRKINEWGDAEYQAHFKPEVGKNTIINNFYSIREAKVAYDYCLKYNRVFKFKNRHRPIEQSQHTKSDGSWIDILQAEIELMLDGKDYEIYEQ